MIMPHRSRVLNSRVKKNINLEFFTLNFKQRKKKCTNPEKEERTRRKKEPRKKKKEKKKNEDLRRREEPTKDLKMKRRTHRRFEERTKRCWVGDLAGEEHWVER